MGGAGRRDRCARLPLEALCVCFLQDMQATYILLVLVLFTCNCAAAREQGDVAMLEEHDGQGTFEEEMGSVLQLSHSELGQSKGSPHAKGKTSPRAKSEASAKTTSTAKVTSKASANTTSEAGAKTTSKAGAKKPTSSNIIPELPEASARAAKARSDLAKAVKDVTGVHMPSLAPKGGEVSTKDLKKASKTKKKQQKGDVKKANKLKKKLNKAVAKHASKSKKMLKKATKDRKK